MAKGARQRGISIERKWQADAYEWTGNEWKVTLTKMVEQGGNLVPSDEQADMLNMVTMTGKPMQRTAGSGDPTLPFRWNINSL